MGNHNDGSELTGATALILEPLSYSLVAGSPGREPHENRNQYWFLQEICGRYADHLLRWVWPTAYHLWQKLVAPCYQNLKHRCSFVDQESVPPSLLYLTPAAPRARLVKPTPLDPVGAMPK